MSLLSRSCWFLLGQPQGIRVLPRHAKGQPQPRELESHIVVQWGGQTPLSLPPSRSLLETLEIRPDAVLTNALQGTSLHWTPGNGLGDLIGLFHL